jgi:hypothetical protein
LVFSKKVDLAFSRKYYDESRLSLLFFVLFFRLPWACAKYGIYLILRFLFSKTRVKMALSYSFVLNFIFVNAFGSPRWLFNLAFSLSRSLREAIFFDLTSKKPSKILLIRLKLCVDAINSCLGRECTYFLGKCNESKVLFKDGKFFFNMKRFFIGQNFKSVSASSNVIRAMSDVGDDCKLEHPIYDSNYDGGSSNGYLFTSQPFPDQKAIALKNDINNRNHCMVINNVHSESMIAQGQFKGLKQETSSLRFLKKLGDTVRYLGDDRIFLQDAKGSRSLNKSYSNLSDDDARNLGFSNNKIKEMASNKIEHHFSSQSEKDLFLNSLNNITEDDLNSKKFNEFKYRMDTRNILKDKNFTDLEFKDQVVEI